MWEPGSTRTGVGNRDLLDRREAAWRPRLEVVSLVAEALDEVDGSDRDEALEALGRVYAVQSGPRTRMKMLERWPSVHVLVTAGVAADHYESGTFWPKLVAALGVRGDQAFHREWGEAFLRNLEQIGLPAFRDNGADAGTRYVGRILMHSGMPTYCLRDFYRLIVERRRRTPGLSPEEFVSWSGTRASVGALPDVDKPVSRFLQHGGEFAIDVSERAFDLLDAVSAGGDGTDVPLPARFREVALARHAAGELTAVPQRSATAGGAEESRPQLVVDPFGQGLILRLPPVGDAPDGQAVWLVTLDGKTHQVGTRALFPGSNEPAPQTDVPMTAPVRKASAALLGRTHLSADLVVVDENEPLMAFAENGTLLPAGSPLGRVPTWLLFPGEPAELRFVGAPTVLSESPLPPGWSGWCLQLVDLAHVSEVALAAGGRPRPVRDRSSARILCDEPVRGVRTSAGLPVITERPRVELPDVLSEARWEVALLDAEGDTIARWLNDGSVPDPQSIWDAVPQPTLGTFTIRVRGPWGRGAQRTFTLAQGLRVVFDPPWRRFVPPAGLQPATASLSVPAGMDANEKQLTYSARKKDAYVRLGAHGVHRTLTVTPPHMSVAYQSDETTTPPSIRPLMLFSESITESSGTLVLNLEASGAPRVHVRTATGVAQLLDPGAERAGVYRFDLSRLADTFRAHPQGELSLDPEGQVVVARFRPQRLFAEIVADGPSLHFTECVEVEGLTALVYPTRAPWRGATVLPITEGHAALPPDLVAAGPLVVAVRLEDPWAPLPVPVWPERRQCTTVDAAGWLRDGAESEGSLSAFLAGEGDPPREVDFDHAWAVRTRLGSLALGDRAGEVCAAIDQAIKQAPRDALLALSASESATSNVASILIETGLVQADLRSAHGDSAPRWTAITALPTALLCAADQIWEAEEVEAATEVCGDVVAELLDGRDPFAAQGRLDDAAEIFDRVPMMRDEFVRSCGLVPRGLLMGDTRVLAVMDFIKHRRDERLEWMIRNAHKVLIENERLLRMIGDPVASSAFVARCHPTASGGWRVVPSLSLGLALAARHAARGNEVAAGWLPSVRRPWSDLAKVVPSLVTTDLLLAEFLVASTGPDSRRTQ
ncbi:hypothetical protein GCM10027270_14820 [Nocardioides ginkgobilobae]